MSKFVGVVIFGLLASLVFLAVQYVFPWFNLLEFYQTTTIRLGSERALAVCLLVIYLLLAAWAVLAFVRWMTSLTIDIARSIKNTLIRKKTPTVDQTLDNTLIIDDPALKRPMVRLMETFFSVAVWLFFVYLLQTIATTLMWIFGLEKFYNFNFSQATIDGTMEAILLTVYTAALFIAIQIAWAEWNQWRFGSLTRRKQAAIVDAVEVANFFNQPIETIRSIQAAKITSITPLEAGFAFREVN
jgi:poly-beta-1,6-N-acetyl-D-glucosamine biosynthesis protein PgaD